MPGGMLSMAPQTNYITIHNTTTNYNSPAELVTALQQLQAQVAALKTAPGLDESDIKMVKRWKGGCRRPPGSPKARAGWRTDYQHVGESPQNDGFADRQCWFGSDAGGDDWQHYPGGK